MEQVEVSAADIARIAGVRPSAVSNWRRRHDDFPKPFGGTEKNPRFELAAVEAWLRRQGKATEISAEERLWQAFDSARGAMPTGDALVAAGLLLYYLHQNPETPLPRDPAGLRRMMDAAEHALAFRGGNAGGGIIGLRSPIDLGVRETTMLNAVSDAAADDSPALVFEYLCARAFDAGSRTGHTVTPPDLAELMLDLAGDMADRLLDPACGSGSILVSAAKRGWTRVEGQEQDGSLALITALRLAFTGSASFDVHAGDSLRKDAYRRPSADAVVCNPPFADRNWGLEELSTNPRWEYGVPPRLESELAWIQHALAHVVPGGPVVMLMPPAAAARPSGKRIRGNLLRAGALRAVISLPPKLAAHYALALQIWVLARPEEDRAYSHVLLVDASGFSATSRAGGPGAESAPSWDEVRATVMSAWNAFLRDPELAATRNVAVAVPVIDLLDEDIDFTPGRHLRGRTAPVSQARLADRREHLADTLADLARLLPEPLEPDVPVGGIVREVSLEDLAQNGAIFIRRAMPQPADDEKGIPGPRVQGRILTSQDIARTVPPSGTGELVADDVRNPPIRAGDVLVLLVGRRLTARVAADQDVGAFLSPSVYLIRPDTTTIDPWFLAGVLSSTSGGHQAARIASTISGHTRFEPRRVRVPLLPIDTQRAYGETFRRLWDFARTLRAVHDEGIDFVRELIDTTASAITATVDLRPVATSQQRLGG